MTSLRRHIFPFPGRDCCDLHHLAGTCFLVKTNILVLFKGGINFCNVSYIIIKFVLTLFLFTNHLEGAWFVDCLSNTCKASFVYVHICFNVHKYTTSTNTYSVPYNSAHSAFRIHKNIILYLSKYPRSTWRAIMLHVLHDTRQLQYTIQSRADRDRRKFH